MTVSTNIYHNSGEAGVAVELGGKRAYLTKDEAYDLLSSLERNLLELSQREQEESEPVQYNGKNPYTVVWSNQMSKNEPDRFITLG